jgi:uncharacterized protein YpbB
MNEFILALFNHSDKLRPSTIYQIVCGKRTSSVLSYAFFYDRLGFFQVLPKLNEQTYKQAISSLLADNQLVADEAGYLQTLADCQQDKAFDRKLIWTHINYFRYGRYDEQMWRLVQLLVQAVAFQGISTHYVPVESTPMYTEPVRHFLRQHPQVKKDLFTELWQVFEQIPEPFADFLVGTLSGPEEIGQTFFQLLPDAYQHQPWNQFFSAAAIHSFLAKVREQAPLLTECLKPFYQENLNQSMLKSRQLFLKGNTVEEIAQIRKIKIGTVNDHLIEWAISDEQFPYHSFAIKQQLPPASWKIPYSILQREVSLDFLTLRINQIAQKRGVLC